MFRWITLSLALLGGLTHAATDDEQVLSKESELKQLRSRINNLESELGDKEKRQQLLEKELQRAEQQIGSSARRLRVLSGSLERQRERLRDLEVKQQSQQAELSTHRQALASQMRSAYAMGRQERIKILLNQQDPAVVSRMLVYYDYFNRARTRRMERIRGVLERLQETEKALLREQQRLAELQQRELNEKRRLDAAQSGRLQVMAALNKDIASKGEKLTGLKKNESRLHSLVKRLQEELLIKPLESISSKSFKSLKGKLEWPSKGRLVARFGTARGGNLKWDGVMIAAPEGREVRAVHHGRVAFADWLRGFGLLLIIDHGDGYMSLYGHNQSLFKETGEWVEPGEAIALVGSSGGQSNPGVYFGIRFKGRPVNPKRWCRRLKGNRIGALMNSVPAQVSEREIGATI